MSTLHVSVWRGTEQGRYVDYEVPRQTSQTVLDVVTYIQRKLDSTLAYRYACRVGMCGSCAMTVNGVARWTCRTHVGAVAGEGEHATNCAACQFAGHARPRDRHARVLRQVDAREGLLQRLRARGTTTLLR